MKRYLIAAAFFLSACSKNTMPDPESGIADSKVNHAIAHSAPGDVVGKITVGYQGWFSCAGDGSPFSFFWWHWAQGNNFPTGEASSIGIKSWPDMREFTTSFQTGFPNLNNGQPAKLFSSYTDQTMDTHFRWMEENGIDVAALQRFNPAGGEGPMRDAITAKVKTAAEAHHRKFYIMYDVSGWDGMSTQIKADWTNKMSAYTSSSAYAVQNGKPVVCIWGLGFKDNSRPFSAEECMDVVNWFKSKGCYVIGGVPGRWRSENEHRPGFEAVYKALNMITPWMIGNIGTIEDEDRFYQNTVMGDQAYCDANGIDYQACILPGDLQERQRQHGEFMWRQFYNRVKGGVQGIYISMFDEFNEGNQIAKTAENNFMVPAGSKFLGLDEDGVVCSSDYYLRLTNDGGKMLKGIIPLTPNRPTEPVKGGGQVYLPPFGQTVSIMGSNGAYVSSQNGVNPMNCVNKVAGGWELFTIVNAGNGKVALMNNGKYVSSENGAGSITCNRTAIGIWEQFTYTKNLAGEVTFMGSNGKFISSENGLQAMTCKNTVAGPWEKFKLN
ncbi:hypothetical protein HDE69_002308 [Pedobacter cryoconitis]|uniref:Lectin n=1 Tax=Pedobacter cryoconitis TaxID=188932 RepID=A0A7W9DJI5_9SPHI|nr:lectin [Pedobacter cryoconitis]MBB5621247.1 hypothetical protein [Pedobacter cryoconitis]